MQSVSFSVVRSLNFTYELIIGLPESIFSTKILDFWVSPKLTKQQLVFKKTQTRLAYDEAGLY